MWKIKLQKIVENFFWSHVVLIWEGGSYMSPRACMNSYSTQFYWYLDSELSAPFQLHQNMSIFTGKPRSLYLYTEWVKCRNEISNATKFILWKVWTLARSHFISLFSNFLTRLNFECTSLVNICGIFDIWHNTDDFHKSQRLGLTTGPKNERRRLSWTSLHSVVNTENHRKVQLDSFSFKCTENFRTSFTRRLRVWIELFYWVIIAMVDNRVPYYYTLSSKVGV